MSPTCSLKSAFVSIFVAYLISFVAATIDSASSSTGVSTVADSEIWGCDVSIPGTLKDALDFFGALKTNNILKKEVPKLLLNHASTFFNDPSYDFNFNFTQLLEKTDELRIALSGNKSYGKYELLKNSVNDKCATQCVNTILDLLPKFQATLYYHYYQVSDRFSSTRVGKWAKQSVKGTAADNYMGKWLSNHVGILSATGSEASLLPGGYTGEDLTENTGEKLHKSLLELVDFHDNGAYLPKLVLATFFSTPQFTHASTASSMFFVAAFCMAVTQSAFDGMFTTHSIDETTLKNACKSILPSVELLTSSYEATDNQLLFASYGEIVDRYAEFADPAALDKSIKWIKDNFKHLKKYIQNMKTDCQKWDLTSLAQGGQSGPFAYGFIIGYSWNAVQNLERTKGELVDKLSKLLDSSNNEGSIYALCKAVGGELEITSAEGNGTADEELPVMKADVVDNPGADVNNDVKTTELGGKPQTEVENINGESPAVVNGQTRTHPELRPRRSETGTAAAPDTTAHSQNQSSEPSTNLTGAVNAQGGNSDVKKSPFFTGGIIAIVVVVALVALVGLGFAFKLCRSRSSLQVEAVSS